MKPRISEEFPNMTIKNKNQPSRYRLVWFQHFHKAGGSSVISTAAQNGEQFFPRHRNANPVDTDGWEIPIWRMDSKGQSAFVDYCEDAGVTFIATEWGAQDYVALRDDPRVFSLTLLRDPWDRLVSNYKFDLARGHTPAVPIHHYFPHHSLAFRQPEYLVRSLAAGRGLAKGSQEKMVAVARDNLHAMDFFADLYDRSATQRFCDLLGWKNYQLFSNKTPNLFMGAIQQAARGDLGFLPRQAMMRSDGRNGISGFRERFETLNPMDRELFNALKGND